MPRTKFKVKNKTFTNFSEAIDFMLRQKGSTIEFNTCSLKFDLKEDIVTSIGSEKPAYRYLVTLKRIGYIYRGHENV